MKIEDNVIDKIFNRLIKKSSYKKEYFKIKKFNSKNKYLKKGLAITPVKFGISLQQFTSIKLVHLFIFIQMEV